MFQIKLTRIIVDEAKSIYTKIYHIPKVVHNGNSCMTKAISTFENPCTEDRLACRLGTVAALGSDSVLSST